MKDLTKIKGFDRLRHEAIKALAVIHNLDYCESHPFLSFFVVRDKTTSEIVLKILDYSNFTKADASGKVTLPWNLTENLERAQEKNLVNLLSALNPSSLGPQVHADMAEYKKLREEKIINFED